MIAVEQYLKTVYRSDRDYVDGHVIERNWGEQSHGRLQGRIGVWLMDREGSFPFQTLLEVRVKVRPDRFRVPDITLIPTSAAHDKIVETVPILCVEILSPKDRMGRMLDRLEDYFSMGVPTSWIVNPETGEAWIATPGQLTKVMDGILRAGAIEMPLAEVLE